MHKAFSRNTFSLCAHNVLLCEHRAVSVSNGPAIYLNAQNVKAFIHAMISAFICAMMTHTHTHTHTQTHALSLSLSLSLFHSLMMTHARTHTFSLSLSPTAYLNAQIVHGARWLQALLQDGGRNNAAEWRRKPCSDATRT